MIQIQKSTPSHHFLLPEHSILLTMQNQPRQKMAMEGAAPGTTREVQNWKRHPVSELIKIIPNNIHKLSVYLVCLEENPITRILIVWSTVNIINKATFLNKPEYSNILELKYLLLIKGSCFVSFLHSTGVSLFPFIGLEYSAGEGTNYPPKFDSSPGKLFCFHPVLFEGWCSVVSNHFLFPCRCLEDCYRGVGHWGLEWGCEYLCVRITLVNASKSRSWNLYHCM